MLTEIVTQSDYFLLTKVSAFCFTLSLQIITSFVLNLKDAMSSINYSEIINKFEDKKKKELDGLRIEFYSSNQEIE